MHQITFLAAATLRYIAARLPDILLQRRGLEWPVCAPFDSRSSCSRLRRSSGPSRQFVRKSHDPTHNPHEEVIALRKMVCRCARVLTISPPEATYSVCEDGHRGA